MARKEARAEGHRQARAICSHYVTSDLILFREDSFESELTVFTSSINISGSAGGIICPNPEKSRNTLVSALIKTSAAKIIFTSH